MRIFQKTTRPLIWLVALDDAAQKLCFDALASAYKLLSFDLPKLKKLSSSMGFSKPALIITDFHLGKMPFTDLLSGDLAFLSEFPFVVLSECKGEIEMQTSFRFSALDYWVRPIHSVEIKVKTANLLAPKRGLARPAQKNSEFTLCGESLCLLKNQIVISKFTAKEFQIFSLLLHGLDETISRQFILESIWKNTTVCEKSFDVHLFHIRKKIAKTRLLIEFVRPSGYRLCLVNPNLRPPPLAQGHSRLHGGALKETNQE